MHNVNLWGLKLVFHVKFSKLEHTSIVGRSQDNKGRNDFHFVDLTTGLQNLAVGANEVQVGGQARQTLKACF